MNVLHITPNSKGYEKVKLIANRVDRNNHLAVIEINGEEHWTGGLLVQDTKETRRVLDSIPANEQYRFVEMFRVQPYAKLYLEE